MRRLSMLVLIGATLLPPALVAAPKKDQLVYTPVYSINDWQLDCGNMVDRPSDCRLHRENSKLLINVQVTGSYILLSYRCLFVTDGPDPSTRIDRTATMNGDQIQDLAMNFTHAAANECGVSGAEFERELMDILPLVLWLVPPK